MEFGRHAGSRRSGLRGQGRLGDHQLGGDAARGPTRQSRQLDPRIGMVGASYGGGIQLATAINDHRIDAIVPTIAWHSLNTALYKDEAFKSSWGTLLAAALIGTNASVNPRIYPGLIYGDITGTLRPEDQQLHRRTRPRRAGRPDHRADPADPGHRRHAVHVGGGRRERESAYRQRVFRPRWCGTAAATAPASPPPTTA